jgi:hypothetical protein
LQVNEDDGELFRERTPKRGCAQDFRHGRSFRVSEHGRYLSRCFET